MKLTFFNKTVTHKRLDIDSLQFGDKIYYLARNTMNDNLYIDISTIDKVMLINNTYEIEENDCKSYDFDTKKFVNNDVGTISCETSTMKLFLMELAFITVHLKWQFFLLIRQYLW